jgi:hypothetical protein
MCMSYALGCIPPFLFGRGIIDRMLRRKPDFSLFTNILGLLASLIFSPFLWRFSLARLWPFIS